MGNKKTGVIETDAYRKLMGDEKAEVEVLVGTSVGFGEVKVHAVVRLTCNQDTNTIYEAGDLAYRTAKDIAVMGYEDLVSTTDAPPLGTPGVPR